MMGPYGWEQTSTAFLQNGQYLSASAEHYGVGTYKEDGGKLTTKVSITQTARKTRAIFGSNAKHVDVRMEGKIEGSDTIDGKARTADKKNKFDIMLRLTRLGDLD